MLKPLILAAAALAAIAHAPSSRADVSGTTTVGTFTYTLRDLNPSDGIAPSIVFAPTQRITAGITVFLFRGELSIYNELYPTGNESLFLLESLGPELWMSGTVDGRATLDTLSVAGAAHASSVGASDGVMPVFSGNYEFILSPHTEVTFSAVIDVDASAAGTEAGFEYASTVTMTSSGWENVTRSHLFDVANFGDAPRSLDLTMPISVTASNIAGAPVSMEMHLLVSNRVFSYAGAVPIPEPGRLPMLATGLLTLGAFARLGRRVNRKMAAPRRS